MTSATLEARRAYNRVYRQRNAEAIRQQNRAYRRANLRAMQARDAAYCLAAKLEAFNAYGGLVCCLCQERRIGALTLDHPNGDGNVQRLTTGCATGKKFYLWLRRHGFPPGYRVLCSNCNWLEYRRQQEPSWSQSRYAIRQRLLKAKKKSEVMTKLGGKCAVCTTTDIRILTVHHINGDGAAHRRKLTNGASGHAFYCALLRTGDFSNLECRCFSCNDAAEWQ